MGSLTTNSTTPQIQPKLARCQAAFCNCLQHIEEHLYQKDFIPMLNISKEKTNLHTFARYRFGSWTFSFSVYHIYVPQPSTEKVRNTGPFAGHLSNLKDIMCNSQAAVPSPPSK